MMVSVGTWIIMAWLGAPLALKSTLGPTTIDWEQRIIQTNVQLPPPPGKMHLVGARLQTEKLAKEKLVQQFIVGFEKIPLGPWVRHDLAPQEHTQQLLAVLQALHRITEIRYFSDGGLFLAGEIPIDGLLAATLLGRQITDVPDENTAQSSEHPPAVSQVEQGGSSELRCSGLIINGLGLGLYPTLSAELVRQDGSQLFARSEGISSLMWRMGLAVYIPDLERARADERVGNRPCVIRALGAGSSLGTWVVGENDQIPIQQAQTLWQEGKVIWVVENASAPS